MGQSYFKHFYSKGHKDVDSTKEEKWADNQNSTVFIQKLSLDNLNTLICKTWKCY